MVRSFFLAEHKSHRAKLSGTYICFRTETNHLNENRRHICHPKKEQRSHNNSTKYQTII